MQFLKADTAVKVVIGPCVAVADGFTPVTTLSLSTADEAELIKHDAASVTDISASTFAAITSADGYYNLSLTTGNVDTEGMLTILINDDSLCLPILARFTVVNANVFDSLFAAATTDYLQVDTIQVTGTAQTANDNGADINAILVDTAEIGAAGAGLSAVPWNSSWDTEVQSECADALTAYDPPTRAELTTDKNSIITEIDANETKIDTLDTVADGIQTDLSNATDGLGALKTLIDAIQTDLGDFSGRTNDQTLLDVLGVPDVAGKDLHTLLVTDRLDNATYGLSALETLVDQVEGYADLIDDATNGLAAIKAEVEGLGGAAMRGTDNAATATALSTHDSKLDTADTAIDAVQTDLDNATDGLGALKGLIDGLNNISTAQVGTEVDTSLSDINLDHLMKTAVADRDVMAEVVDGTVLANIMTKTDGDTSDFDPDSDSLEAIRDNQSGSAASIADAVWDEAIADHQAAGTTGEALEEADEKRVINL